MFQTTNQSFIFPIFQWPFLELAPIFCTTYSILTPNGCLGPPLSTPSAAASLAIFPQISDWIHFQKKAADEEKHVSSPDLPLSFPPTHQNATV